MAQANINGELREELEAVAAQAGCELVHAEFRGSKLTLFLDRPQGVTLGDCEKVSKEVSVLLDIADFGKGRYTLEVSSPGLDRQLYRPKDYERFCGHLVRVTYIDPETSRKATVVGRLEKFCPAESEPASEITVSELQAERCYDIALRDIQLARLEIEL